MPKYNTLRTPSHLRANDSYTFLMKELEKVDERILEPLTGTDWPRDMPVITGGGLLESIVSVDVTYASTGRDEDNLIFDATNDIPVVQADMSQSVARCFNFAEYMSFSTLEREKMMNVGRDPETFLNKGIRLHCDKAIDRSVYRGFDKVRSTGLINNPNVTRVSAKPVGEGNTSSWATKTADQILDDINTVIAGIWKACDCSSDALPNHILVPVEQFGLLVTRKVSDDSERSILTYVLENNLTNQQGGHLVISPCKWCSKAGVSDTDRLVCYINDPEKICFNLTQPLRRMDTEYAEMRIKIPYIAQFSEVRFLYPTTVRYMDGI
ncbi:MAG: DUF2184 domain-containing protein [Clostridia bacterium]|nr:DUF2184 domain-containing protein [Clostridia bacterium]